MMQAIIILYIGLACFCILLSLQCKEFNKGGQFGHSVLAKLYAVFLWHAGHDQSCEIFMFRKLDAIV